MPRATPKKDKTTTTQQSIKHFLTPVKLTDSNSKGRRVLQNSVNVQERVSHMCKKKEGPANNGHDLLQNAEEYSHTFQFRYKKSIYAVACDTSRTVFDALNTNKIFRKILEENLQKEIVLQRSKGEVQRAAVKTDFPCCLIDKDEVIDVGFIKKVVSAYTPQKPTRRFSFLNESENLVAFYIKTKGKEKVKHLMKNKELWKNHVDNVCVYAFKEEKLKTALKRDGRFNNIIFKKHCVLSEFGSETIHEMSHPVKHLDRKHFLVVVISDNIQADSQDDFLSPVQSESNAPSAADVKENVDPNQHPISIGQQITQKLSGNWPAPEIIPGSKDIQKILCDENRYLLEKLKQQKNLKGNSQVKKFFRTEYDKSVASFSEVKKVKKLMRLSNSVCQIRVEGSARGTGFLLFNRFILTNAHVIGEFDPFTRKLSKTFTAVFGFEDLEQKEAKRVAIREHAAAYYHGKDDMNRHLDFALLELDVIDEALDCPELLRHYSNAPPPNRGGICIVGHPDGGVKKMDPCFIIGKENQLEAADKHISENVHFYHVITQQNLSEKWEMHVNQISYDSCFFHGSSGSPVFDEYCCLTGVHTGGYVYRGEGAKTRSVMEYAYSMQPILESIVKQAENNKRSDIIKLLSEFKSLNLNLNMEANDVEMTEVSQNQEDCK